jgi:transposase
MRRPDPIPETQLDDADRKRLTAALAAAREATTLLDRPRSGHRHGQPTLTPRRLAAALARDLRRSGYQATSWAVPLLTHYLAAHEGIAVSPRTLRRRLHEAGYRWKRPRYVYVQRAAHLPQEKEGWSGV